MIKKLLFGILILCQIQATAQVSKKTSLSPLLEISMIGTAAEGWETDVVLQTTDGINYYSSPYAFKTGALKFRQGRLWTVNWGSLDFPIGIGIQSGEDIPVVEGVYTVQFNVQTGAYSFEKSCVCPALYAPVCANGKMYENECIAKCAGETIWFNGTCESNEIKVVISGTSLNEKITLNKGGVGMMAPSPKLFSTVQNFNTGTLKFEVQEADMLYHMAAETFPSGKATTNYEITIPVKEGTYALVFDLETGQYDFHATPYITIAGVNLTQVDNQGNYEAKDVILGETDLEILDNDYGNDALMVLYGNNFPQGLATMEVLIPVKTIPGTYNIYYNTNTKEYRFESATTCICPEVYMPVCANGKTYGNSCEAQCAGETTWVDGACKKEYPVITITGTAVGGWDKDVEMKTTDGINYVLHIYNQFVEGEFKFRQDFDWKINWGGTTVPEGVGVQGGPNIPVKYPNIEQIEFNRITGVYTVYCLYTLDMNPVCANGKTYSNASDALCSGLGLNDLVDGACKETYVDIFGSAVGDPVRMIFENGIYTVKNKELSYGDVYFGGKLEGKSFQIGGNSFPSGEAIFDEKPVLADAGEYDIELNIVTGGKSSYNFIKKNMGIGDFNKNSMLVYPNPVKDILNISSNDLNQAKIYDCTGRLVKEGIITNQKIDLSELSSGNYILKIQSSANQETIKIVKE